jgi:hypothetical protein
MIDRAFISGITLGFLTAPLAANASGTTRPQRESSAAKKAARIAVLYPGATTASSGQRRWDALAS